MSIDRIGRPGPDADADEQERARPQAPDSPRPGRSVNEEFLDAMDGGQVIGRDDPHERDSSGARSETRTSDIDAARPPAVDTSRVRKSVNEEFLDAMDEDRVIGRDDLGLTAGRQIPPGSESGIETLADAEHDTPRKEPNQLVAEKDARAADEQPKSDDLPSGGGADPASADDAEGIPGSTVWEQGNGPGEIAANRPEAIQVHPDVPLYKEGDKVRGVVKVGEIEIPLISGEHHPGKWLKENLQGGPGSGLTRAWTHVEGQTAGLMHRDGIKDADLYINKIPCGKGAAMCRFVLHKILPDGSTLRVHFPESGEIKTWKFESGVPKWTDSTI